MIGYMDIPKTPPAIVQTVVFNPPYWEVQAELTAYTSSVEDCGKSDGVTASGVQASRGTVAAPINIPFGTIIEFDGKLHYVQDRGGAIVVKEDGTYVIDVWLPTKAEVTKFGRRKTTIKIWRRTRYETK